MTGTQDNVKQLNGIALAYIGDAIYEVYIRHNLINVGITKPTILHHKATGYVSAKAQAALLELMLEKKKLSETEQYYFRRGRNATSHTHAKNTNVVTYRISTGFEAMFGYLYLSGQIDRVGELANWCIDQVREKRLPKNER